MKSYRFSGMIEIGGDHQRRFVLNKSGRSVYAGKTIGVVMNDQALGKLEKIQRDNGFTSMSETVRFLINNYEDTESLRSMIREVSKSYKG